MTADLKLQKKYKLVADTIRCYPLQFKQAWDEVGLIKFPDNLKKIDNIIFCGMGGSALGARMIKSYSFNTLRIPFEIYNDYKLPNYANSKSLVVLSSYSGTTEETLETAHDGLKRNCKLFGITTGGKLAEFLKKEKIPYYVFDPNQNPSKQPRMSIGYASGAILSLLNKLGVVSVVQSQVDKACNTMFETLTDFNENLNSNKNLPKSFSEKLKGKTPILVASEHLVGCAHTIKNQFNESAKTFSALFDIPELNHHLMEGLKNPQKLRDYFIFVFLDSNLYSEKISKRYILTEDVVKKNGYDYLVFSPHSEEKLSQMFETLIFGSFVVYNLTKAYNIDPLEIPWVDYFKAKLSS